MPIGVGTYPQGEKFSLVRSYISAFAFSSVWTLVSNSTGSLILHDAGNPTLVFHVNMRLKWWLWTSNFYTLDFIMQDAYYVDTTTGGITPFPFTFIYVPATETTPSCVAFRQFGAPPPFTYVTLPPPPPHYWLEPL